ncbi:hypothetical protein [Tsuneonella mangrovi]|uniref:hypothetical protein n=1 Tax=Tsuneonella mangrovi TaxID=1982042 RepID=UPI000BA2739A|nr:hypothetical protein [Tsuneonella mangrovi]
MVKLVYFTASALMGLFALFMVFNRGLLWGLAIAGASAGLAFMGLAREEDEDSEGNGNARR